MNKVNALIILILFLLQLGCSSLQLAGDINNPDESLEVATITLGSYLIADRLKGTSMDYPAPAPKL
jgi:hypothetical protein